MPSTKPLDLLRFTTCLHPNMWTLANPEGINIVAQDVIDVAIPFDKLGVEKGQTVDTLACMKGG